MSARLFVGNLPSDIRQSELDDLFYKYGPIRDIAVKHPSEGRAYAFVEFKYYEDAEYAVRRRNNCDYDGYRLRVEFSRSSRNDRYRSGPPRHSDYRVTITPVPKGTSWQSIKDVLKPKYKCGFTDVRGDIGYCEFSCRSDMEKCIEDFDNKNFVTSAGEGIVRVVEDKLEDDHHSSSRRSSSRRSSSHHRRHHRHDRSRTPSKSSHHSHSSSRSHSHSPSGSHTPSHSVSHSPSNSHSISHSKSMDKSNSRNASPAHDKSISKSRSRSNSEHKSISKSRSNSVSSQKSNLSH
ncbi:hypothetical protein WA158_005665 [Blastocystis sp. Blastoise]